MTAYLAATLAQSTLPLFYDIALHTGLGELFAQSGYLGLKLRDGAAARGHFGRRAAHGRTHPVGQRTLGKGETKRGGGGVREN